MVGGQEPGWEAIRGWMNFSLLRFNLYVPSALLTLMSMSSLPNPHHAQCSSFPSTSMLYRYYLLVFLTRS